MKYFVLIATLLQFFPGKAEASTGYRVTTEGNVMVITTPYGSKTFLGDAKFASAHSYRFALPIKEFQSTDAPEAKSEDKADTASPAALKIELVAKNESGVKATVPAPDTAGGLPNGGTADKPTEKTPEKSAEDLTKKTIENTNQDVAPLLKRANLFYNQRKYSECEFAIDTALRRNPNSARAWIMKGSILKLKGKKEEALNAWEKARKIDPENPEVQTLLEGY